MDIFRKAAHAHRSSPSSSSDTSSDSFNGNEQVESMNYMSDFNASLEIDRRMPAFMNPVWRPLPHERPLYGTGLPSLDIYSDAFSELSDESEGGKTASLVEGLLGNIAALSFLPVESDAISDISRDGNESTCVTSELCSSSAGRSSRYDASQSSSEDEGNGHRLRISAFYSSLADSCSDVWISLESPVPPPFGHYSRKVFVGALPYGIKDNELRKVFEVCGTIRIVRPSIEMFTSSRPFSDAYVYIIMENEMNVSELLEECVQTYDGRYLLPVWSKNRFVEVIPWLISGRLYSPQIRGQGPAERSVFVGGLHGTMTASLLAKVMQDLFGEVTYAAIDVDNYQYPTGSGRVTFRYHRGFAKAVKKEFISICTGRFSKKVQIQPYLEKDGGACETCGRPNALQFCKSCKRNFCWRCFGEEHRNMPYHVPMSRWLN